MSELSKLIDELCPSGVGYKELHDVAEMKRGKGLSKDVIGTGNIPIILYGELYTTYGDYITEIFSHTDIQHINPTSAIERNSLVLPISSTTAEAMIGKASVVRVDGCFLGSDAIQIIPDETIDSSYLMYLMNCYDFERKKMKCVEGTTIRHLKPNKLMKIEIPVPPMEVQKEIVRILDTFTELIELLTEELDLRKKQYAYYRDKLLSFEDEDVEWVSLGDVILNLRTGLNPRKNFKLNTPDAEGYYVTVRELADKEIKLSSKTDRVNKEALKLIDARSNLMAGDVLFSATGTIGNTALVKEKPINWNIKEGVYAITPDHSKITSEYLLFWLHSTKAVLQFEKQSEGGTVKSVSMKKFKTVKLPLPPLGEQERIAGMLDKFDALVNSLTEGIPAEIEGRRKQYEYYRDKLLTFERLN